MSAPYSTVSYTGNGVLTQFAIPFPYVQQADIQAQINGVVTTFTWANSTTIQFAVAPANGTTVYIYRQSVLSPASVVFADGSVLTSANLNTEFTQVLYGVQEAWDQTTATINAARTQSGNLPAVTNTNNGQIAQVSGGLWTVGLPLVADTSLTSAVAGLSVHLADTSLTTASGLKVNLNATGGLSTSSGVKILAADSTITVGATGINVALAAGGGLAVSGGLYVRGSNTTTADGSPANGDVWYRTDTGQCKRQQSGQVMTTGGTLFINGPGAAVANTTALTAASSGTINANFLGLVGRTLRVKATISYGNTLTPTLTVGLYANGTANLLASSVMSITSGTAGVIQVEYLVYITATGAGGTTNVSSRSDIDISGAAGGFVNLDNTASAINTTIANSLSIGLTWSAASVSNTATVQQMVVEVLQ